MPAAEHKGTPTFAEEGMSNADLAKEVRDLRNALAATRAGLPQTLVPANGAGVGGEFAETWSLAEQERQNATDDGWPGHPSTQMSFPPGVGKP